MPEPTLDTFRMLAAWQDVELSDERLAASFEAHAAMRADLLALRALPLSFLEPVPEPDSALRWIERGGVPA